MTTLSLMAILAHPDDESFAVGGTLARYYAEGVKITLLTATRGELSTLGVGGWSREELAAMREVELQRAASALGLSDVRILGYSDGAVGTVPLEELGGGVLKIMEEVMPDVVITFHPAGVTGHPDHVAISRAVTSAFQQLSARATGHDEGQSRPSKLYYWVVPQSIASSLNRDFGTTFLGVAEEEIAAVIDVRDFLGVQSKAILEHHSQCEPFPPVLRARLERQAGKEYFALAVSRIGKDFETGHDLFAGLRLPGRARAACSVPPVEE